MRQRRPRSWYQGSPGLQKGIEDVTAVTRVPLTPTFLGSYILRMRPARVSDNCKNYRHSFPRTLRTQIRRLRAVEYLRYRYHLGMNRIAETLGSSTKTVWLDVQLLRKIGHAAFDAIKKRYRRSKKSRGLVNTKGLFVSWKTLSERIRRFILGLIDSIELALGDDPP